MYYQQGDVLLKRVSEVPRGAEEMKNTNTVAEGELTGHAHRTNHPVRLFAAPGDTQVGFMDAPRAIVLEHEEHKPIEIPAGRYEVEIVREYDHFEEEARAVAD